MPCSAEREHAAASRLTVDEVGVAGDAPEARRRRARRSSAPGPRPAAPRTSRGAGRSRKTSGSQQVDVAQLHVGPLGVPRSVRRCRRLIGFDVRRTKTRTDSRFLKGRLGSPGDGGTVAGSARRRAGRARSGAVRGDGAGRSGRRRHHRRPRRQRLRAWSSRRRPATSTAGAAGRSASTSSRPTASRWCARLADGADVFVEGFRPGVAERLGLGPDVLRGRNPRLVYARMTGWGQDGPMAAKAGHDINYVALAGPLAHIGRAGQPPTRAAQPGRRLRRRRPADGPRRVRRAGRAGHLRARARSSTRRWSTAPPCSSAAMAPAYTTGASREERGTNLLDSGAPFYDCYETADGKWLVDRRARAASSTPTC